MTKEFIATIFGCYKTMTLCATERLDNTRNNRIFHSSCRTENVANFIVGVPNSFPHYYTYVDAVLVRFVMIGLGSCKVELGLPLLLRRHSGGLPADSFSGVPGISDM